MLSPLLPFNSEHVYKHSKINQSASPTKSLFTEQWPVATLQKVKFQGDLVERAEIIRRLKLSARKIFIDERMMKSGNSSYNQLHERSWVNSCRA